MDSINKLFAEYEQAVMQEILTIFQLEIAPFMATRGYSFSTGNGDFWIRDSRGNNVFSSYLESQEDIQEDDDLRRIVETLCQVPPGFPQNNLGSLMPDFR